jgi:hypothetical protein
MVNNINAQFDEKQDVNANTQWLTNFVEVYQQLATDNLHLLEGIYHQDVNFIDPMHEINGFTDLANYFNGLYQNVTSCQFTVTHIIEKETEAAIYWLMVYQHKQLNRGDKITVSGSSHLKSVDDKVIYHRDYVDLGEMLYQRLPFVGRLITWIKNRAAS